MRYFDQTLLGSIVSRVTNDTETLFEFWFVFFKYYDRDFWRHCSLSSRCGRLIRN